MTENKLSINKDDVEQIKMLSSSAESAASDSLAAYAALKHSIDHISMESDLMTDTVGEIEKLILQTRILSLNASVEGARAGEQGRAFSTIASEMANLADAIKKNMLSVKTYSTNIVSGVKASSAIAYETEEAIEIVEMSVQLVHQFIGDIEFEPK